MIDFLNVSRGASAAYEYDPLSEILYVAQQQTIVRYHVGSDTFLSSIQFGGFVSSLSLSADGKTLVIGMSSGDYFIDAERWWDAQFGQVLFLYDLETDTYERIVHDVTGSERGIANIAIGADETVFWSSLDPDFNGFNALWGLDPDTGEVTDREDQLGSRSIETGSSFVVSETNEHVVLVQRLTDRVAIYDAASQTFGSYNLNTGWFSDVSSAAGALAGGDEVRDFNGVVLADLGGFPIGSYAFSTDGETLYGLNSADNLIYRFETVTWNLEATYHLDYLTEAPDALRFVTNLDTTDHGYLLLASNLPDQGFATLDLRAPAQTVFLSDGADAHSGRPVMDILVGEGGDDTLNGRAGNDALHGNYDNDLLVGGIGFDTLLGDRGDDTLIGGSGYDVLDGDRGYDSLVGNFGQDSITGGGRDDTLVGGLGSDTLDGGDDNDIIIGGSGADSLFGGRDADSIEGNEGADTIDGGPNNDTIFGGINSDLIFGNSGDDSASGGTGADTIFGGLGRDRLVGNAGADSIDGGDGTDVIDGGVNNDTLHGGRSNDLLLGGSGSDVLFGGENIDRLFGGGGNDQLFGDAGDDSLIGDYGNDLLTGGEGNDNFVFLSDHGSDTVVDFVPGEDVLEIEEELLANSDPDFDDLAPFARVTDQNVLILDFGNGNSIRLEGIDDFLSLANSVVFLE